MSMGLKAMAQIKIKINGSVNSSMPPPYEGAYEVTPTVEGQTLPTANKTMKRDLEIREIPYYDVSNTAGGSTVYIAGKLEFE